jgi:hypothetical protein
MQLQGLPGLKAKKIKAEYFKKISEIETNLNKNIAVTTAGDNGAINIWKDDEGKIRCESYSFCKTLDSQIYSNISNVNNWAAKWLKEIK